jgi:2'-5' RNA ligase
MFVAVVPPDDVLAELDVFCEPRREAAAESPWRWALAEQWHLTLAFLPGVPDADYEALCECLAAAALPRPQFELSLAGAGSFSNPSRAKVLWCGVTGDLERLRALSDATRSAANQAGVVVDGQKHRPHLTLARAGRPVQATRWLRVFETFQSAKWVVGEIDLIESHLGQGPNRHPRYETRERFPLSRAR